jgi:hypothetical protein
LFEIELIEVTKVTEHRSKTIKIRAARVLQFQRTAGRLTRTPNAARAAAMSNLVTKLVGELVSHRDHTIDHTEEACRTVLETMRQMLPLLLKKFLLSSSFRGDPVDQLCKLIGLLIEGDVCPHAIGIFDELKEVRGGECAGIESCQECSVCVCVCVCVMR